MNVPSRSGSIGNGPPSASIVGPPSNAAVPPPTPGGNAPPGTQNLNQIVRLSYLLFSLLFVETSCVTSRQNGPSVVRDCINQFLHNMKETRLIQETRKQVIEYLHKKGYSKTEAALRKEELEIEKAGQRIPGVAPEPPVQYERGYSTDHQIYIISRLTSYRAARRVC